MILKGIFISISILALGFLLISEENQVTNIPSQNSSVALTEPGLMLLQKHCYTCHNPKTASHDEIIAPPLFGIKNQYLKRYPEEKEFQLAMSEFVANPNEDKALMKGPIKRFGLMPKPPVSEEYLKVIIEYIRKNELEKPTWYDQHHGDGSH